MSKTFFSGAQDQVKVNRIWPECDLVPDFIRDPNTYKFEEDSIKSEIQHFLSIISL